MRVVFLEDVEGVAQGGDVKEVKNGFARNYLIPQQLAVAATKSAMQRVERLTREAEVQRLKQLADMRALAEELDGTQVNIEMRAGTNRRLYGSVTNAIVAQQLSELTAREIDRRTIDVPEPIREIGFFDIDVRLHEDVDASIKVLVYPAGTDPEDMMPKEESEEGTDEAGVESAEGAEESTPEASLEEAAPEAEPAEENGDGETSEDEAEPESETEEEEPAAEPEEEEE